MNIRRSLGLAVAGAALLAGSATGAQALNWNSASNPLTVSGYGSTGYGYGTWTVSTGSDGTRSRLSANLKYSNADNHKVFAKLQTYVNAGYCLSSDYLSCTAQYYYYTSSDTSRVNQTGVWVNRTTSTGLPGEADYARAGVQVRLDIPVRPDVGSGITWTKGLKY